MTKIIQADCVGAMQAMDEASVDAIVTDPPYGIRFMGKAWDGADIDALAYDREFNKRARSDGRSTDSRRAQAAGTYDLSLSGNRAFQMWSQAWATEALRVLKPGGHLLAFGGTRTYHRLACAIEDAGFEIRDSVIWLYGSGFPKSLDVSKQLDKAAGAEREVVGFNPSARISVSSDARNAEQGKRAREYDAETGCDITAPATPQAQQWQGWGTAMKPAHEPIVVARKPLIGTVAQNVSEHGTGAINVDGCRIGSNETLARPMNEAKNSVYNDTFKRFGNPIEPAGRWPANVALSPEAAAELDRQSGDLPGGNRANRLTKPWGFGERETTGHEAFGYGDTGGASRFFATFPWKYQAKASRAERNAGLDGFEEREAASLQDNGGEFKTGSGNERANLARNNHPTVKPIDLMRWLVRLVTPPGGTVLDPFTGSGTTGIAATLEGFDFIGIEREAEYAEIAKARIEHWQKVPQGTETKAALKQEAKERKRKEKEAQDGLF